MVTENESVLIRIANRVRQLREDSGLSQDAFARLVPCHRSQVSQVERGVNNLSLDTIERFSAALGVDPVSLLQDGPAIARKTQGAIELRERVARNVHLLRTTRGLAQDALSESAGLSRNYVSTLEVRKKNVSLAHLEALVAVLGVPLQDVFDPELSIH
ncbi:helix-turn-helix domain-containing protein [Ralstonia holmesii]|uniref:helix-turn-helix domain-containing protein n=1 Tax=Ralstonia holmesii TaxID=3058602 RepID=UPI003F14112A